MERGKKDLLRGSIKVKIRLAMVYSWLICNFSRPSYTHGYKHTYKHTGKMPRCNPKPAGGYKAMDILLLFYRTLFTFFANVWMDSPQGLPRTAPVGVGVIGADSPHGAVVRLVGGTSAGTIRVHIFHLALQFKIWGSNLSVWRTRGPDWFSHKGISVGQNTEKHEPQESLRAEYPSEKKYGNIGRKIF